MKRSHIILIGGWWSSVIPYFMSWAWKLHARLVAHYKSRKDVKIWVVSSDGGREKPAIAAVLKDAKNGVLGQVAIGGHSNGGGETDLASQLFYAAGIKIQYAFTIDRTLGYTGAFIYGSVSYFDEFWAGLRKTKFHSSFTGTKKFWDIDKIMGKDINHTPSASLPFVQDKLFTEITTRIK